MTTDWVPPAAQPEDGLGKAALTLGCISLPLLFVAGIGWLLDVPLGPVAFGISVAALVRGVRARTAWGKALAGLLLSLPAFAWACYAVIALITSN